MNLKKIAQRTPACALVLLLFLGLSVQLGSSLVSTFGSSDILAQVSVSACPQVSKGLWGLTGTQMSCSDIAAGEDGGVYSIGTMTESGTYSIGPVLVKWDVRGNPVWSSIWNRSAECRAQDLAVHDGFVYALMVGTGARLFEVIVAKWDQSGNVLWFRSIGTTGMHVGCGAITTDDNGFIYVLVSTYHRIADNAEFDNLFMKLDPQGMELWNVSAHHCLGFDAEFDIVAASNRTVFTNFFNSSGVCKWDSDGHLLGSLPLGDGGINQLALDSDGYVYSLRLYMMPSRVTLTKLTQDLSTVWQTDVPAWRNETEIASLMVEDVCTSPGGSTFALARIETPPRDWALFQFDTDGTQTRNWTLLTTDWTVPVGRRTSFLLSFGMSGLLYIAGCLNSLGGSSLMMAVFNPENVPLAFTPDAMTLVAMAVLGTLALAILVDDRYRERPSRMNVPKLHSTPARAEERSS